MYDFLNKTPTSENSLFAIQVLINPARVCQSLFFTLHYPSLTPIFPVIFTCINYNNPPNCFSSPLSFLISTCKYLPPHFLSSSLFILFFQPWPIFGSSSFLSWTCQGSLRRNLLSHYYSQNYHLIAQIKLCHFCSSKKLPWLSLQLK